MLARLRELHAEILEKLMELDHLVAVNRPQIDRLMSVRHALTRASRARTKLLEVEIYPHLLARLDDADAKTVRALQLEGKSDLITSSQHIGRWSLRTITNEWSQYQMASNAMRSAMRRRIRIEQADLYPLLVERP